MMSDRSIKNVLKVKLQCHIMILGNLTKLLSVSWEKLTVFIVHILPLAFFAEQWMAESPEFMLEQIGLAVLWKNPHLITYGLPLF